MHTSKGLLQADIQLVLGIVATLGSLRLRGSLERVPSTKHLGKDVGHCERVSLWRAVGVPELIKVLALLGV
jgi:hypothetical protein